MTLIRLVLLLSLVVCVLSPRMATAVECKDWVAQAVSVQGSIQTRRASDTQWQLVRLRDTFCAGDMLWVQEWGRVAVMLRNDTLLRLDQNTTLTFLAPENERTFLVRLLLGAVHFFSRVPQGLKLITPFVNAAVEGTEFFARVEREHTFLSILTGQVVAANALGSVALTSGQTVQVAEAQAPVRRVVVQPRDAVQWALYYPPLVEYLPEQFRGASSWQVLLRRSLELYQEGNLPMAFATMMNLPEAVHEPRFFTYRAGFLLTVGRVVEAGADIERALALEPRHSPAFALRAMLAVVHNNKDVALDLARQAVELEPNSAMARVALSYAQQAHFDLQGAVASLQEAVRLAPQAALVWARLAELWLSSEELGRAVQAAQTAVALNANLARTHTVLGFAWLTQVKIRQAQEAFTRAIELDQVDPLPRLGLGLATIRQGDLTAGRREMEIAASLDPNNALIRSYLGKVYFEEKRDTLAGVYFTTAKALDALDPTPWLYDAIRKQTINRPVEALQDLQKSIALNDHRAVYRSRLLLDEDLAVRSASLARIYRDLGFQQLALVEGWKSLNTDPGNYSAHRFLADAYSILPRHEIARVSELLQSQLLQPLNITPVQPQLAESESFILAGVGPSDPAFNEFNPLFHRNRFAIQANGVVGGNQTFGDDLVYSGVQGRVAYSLGQFHYETDGFRANNDLRQDIYNVFVQATLSHKMNVQAEFRYVDTEKGDLFLRFDPENFRSNLREKARTEAVRLGLRYSLTPHSDVVVSASYRSAESDTIIKPDTPADPQVRFPVDETGYSGEVQHLFRTTRFSMISGVGHFTEERRDAEIFKARIHHTNLYVYTQISYPKNITWTLGGSADFFDGGIIDRIQFNPKIGLTWSILPATTLRVAVVRTLKRTLLSNQTLEPTQVAGFNQLFDDAEGTEAWRYGIGLDQKFSPSLYAGAEFSQRDLQVPGEVEAGAVEKFDLEERLGRAYVYWTPHTWLAFGIEYQYEHFTNARDFLGPEELFQVATHRVSLGVNFFHPSGFIARLQPTYINQSGKFGFGDPSGDVRPGDDQFWIVDTAVGYRLPRRLGLVTLAVRNLFNQDFRFQDTDPQNPAIYPERLVLARFTLAF